MMNVSGIKAPHTVRVAPAGMCIYCGATESALTDEHIIPKGLGGTLVLPKASCGACARLTSQFEMRVLRGFLDRGRQAIGIKGRKAHKRLLPASVTHAFVQADESVMEEEIPWDDGLKVMHLPVFTLPGFLGAPGKLDPQASGIEVMAVDSATFGPNVLDIVRNYAAVGVRFEDTMDIWAFVQMLAKIAHGYHVAIHGLFPLHQSPLVSIILGKRTDARNWVGNIERQPLPTNTPALHLLDHNPLEGVDGSQATAVRIKLFTSRGAPTYVLASRIQSPANVVAS